MSLNFFNKDILKLIVEKLVTAARPQKVILFGSYARDEMTEDSDIDLIIIEEEVKDKGKEMVRLRNIIGNVGVSVDVLVYSQKEMNDWGHLPGTALYTGLKEGKTLYDATH